MNNHKLKANDPQKIQEGFTADDLVNKLWGGFSRYALPEMEKLKRNTSVSQAEIECTVWELIRWYYFEKKYGLAYENINFLEERYSSSSKDYLVAKILCLIKLQKYDEAKRLLDDAMTNFFIRSAVMQFLAKLDALNLVILPIYFLMRRLGPIHELYMLKSTVMRNLLLGKGVDLAKVESIQLKWLNCAFNSVGMAQLKKKNAFSPLSFINITSAAKSDIRKKREKVSIIMPVFNSENTVGHAIESLLNQTWKNIEIIVIDDCSTDNTCSIIEKYCLEDIRVKLIRKSINEGTYSARNTGLNHVKGDYITVHDSDDWSHPQKIEYQVRTLSRNKKSVGVMSYWVKVGSSLEFMDSWTVRKKLTGLDYSSLLVRKEVIDTLGNWDEVRIAGDAEYRHRIFSFYGPESIVNVQSNYILSFSLVRQDSLTRSMITHKRNSSFGLRWHYKNAYLYWHSKEYFKSAPRIDEKNRLFPVPRGMKINTKPRNYDLVLITDLAKDDDIFEYLMKNIITACESRKKVAVYHWPDYKECLKLSLNPAFYNIAVQYDIDILTPDDKVETEIILIGYPELIQYMIDDTPDIHTNQILILSNEYQSRLINNNISQYNPEKLNKYMEKLFYKKSEWISRLDNLGIFN